jgi:hypothetical protein
VTKSTTIEALLATGVNPTASGGVVAPVEDGGEMAEVVFITPACMYCGCVIDDYAHHLKDIDGNVFTPFVVCEGSLFHNLGWILYVPPKCQVSAPATS